MGRNATAQAMSDIGVRPGARGERKPVLATKDHKEHREGVLDILVLYVILCGRMSEYLSGPFLRTAGGDTLHQLAAVAERAKPLDEKRRQAQAGAASRAGEGCHGVSVLKFDPSDAERDGGDNPEHS